MRRKYPGGSPTAGRAGGSAPLARPVPLADQRNGGLLVGDHHGRGQPCDRPAHHRHLLGPARDKHPFRRPPQALLAYHAYRDPWVKGWRILFLMPMLFMPSAVAFLWKMAFFDGRVVSDLLMRAGLVDSAIPFLSSIWLARMTLIVADVWQWTPFLFIIFVAGLQSQDQEIEEAARLDGASWFQIFWNISLPLMRPIIAVAVVLRGIDISTIFASVSIMTAGTPGGMTETISYFIYRTGFRMFNFGYASAASVVMLVLTIIVAQTVVKRAFRSGRD
jgi:multiple sugar transport system permease protein